MAAEWIVALREAKLGTRATIMLLVTGMRVLQRRGTMLLKAWRACKFTLLFLSVSLGQKTSNTYLEGGGRGRGRESIKLIECVNHKYLVTRMLQNNEWYINKKITLCKCGVIAAGWALTNASSSEIASCLSLQLLALSLSNSPSGSWTSCAMGGTPLPALSWLI